MRVLSPPPSWRRCGVGGLGRRAGRADRRAAAAGRRRRRRRPGLRAAHRRWVIARRRGSAAHRRAGVGGAGDGAHRRAPRRRAGPPGVGAGHGPLAPLPAPDGTGWPDNPPASSPSAGPSRRWSGATRPTCCTSTTGTPAPSWPPCSAPPPVVLTLHNVAYQGVTDGLAAPARPAGRHYEWWGGTNPLSGAIALADAVVAVSPTTPRDPHAGRRVRPRRVRCATLARRVGDPQRHRHRALGPGDRPSPAGALRRRRRPPRDRRRQGGQPAGGAGPLRMARRRHAAGRDGHAGSPTQKGVDLLAPDRRRCCATSRCAWSCWAPATRRWPGRWPGWPPTTPATFAFVEALRRGAGPPAVRRRRRVRHAEPLRAVRARPDAGDALRRDPGRDRASAGCATPCPTSTPIPTATASSPTGSSAWPWSRRCSGPPGCSPTGGAGRRSCAGSWRSTGRGAARRRSTYVDEYARRCARAGHDGSHGRFAPRWPLNRTSS